MINESADQQVISLATREDRTAREHFIPIRRADLVAKLVDSLPSAQRQPFLDLSQLLAATFHHEFHQRMEQMKESYAVLDPDRDTYLIGSDGRRVPEQTRRPPAATEAAAEKFFSDTIDLLERANFRRLDRAHIEEAIESASDWGVDLEVDFNLFERLEVFARGDVVSQRTRKKMRNFWREEIVDVPLYQRLVVAFQLRADHGLKIAAESNQVYLKLFKNIPKMDLDMLLPGTRVKMTRFDQGKIILPTLSGIAMALVKIIKGVALLATATVSGLISFLGILGGTIGYGVKSFLGYLRTKDKYQLNLTRSLYFQNLDNNAGVLFRLLDEAEEQEVREALLAWFLLWKQAPESGWTDAELDRVAEEFLEQQFAIHVDFEVDDAMAKLQRLGLSRCDESGRITAIGLDEALVVLDRAWDNLFQYHQENGQRRAA